MTSFYPSSVQPSIQHSMAFDDMDDESVENEAHTYDEYCYLTPKACFSSAQSPPWEIAKAPCKKIVTFSALDMEGAPLIPETEDSRNEWEDENLDSNTSRVNYLRPRYSPWRHDAKATVAIFRRCDDSLLEEDDDCPIGNSTGGIAPKCDATAGMNTVSKPPPSRRSSLDLSGANARTYSALAA